MPRMDLVQVGSDVRARTYVTTRTPDDMIVRVRTIDWPERDVFLAEYDRLRTRAQLRDVEVADRAEISHSSISSWRTGRQRPSLRAIKKIAVPLRASAKSLAQIGGIEYLDNADEPEAPILPVEFEELIDNYGRMNPDGQADLLRHVGMVNEWAEARLANADSTAKPRRQTG